MVGHMCENQVLVIRGKSLEVHFIVLEISQARVHITKSSFSNSWKKVSFIINHNLTALLRIYLFKIKKDL